MNDKTSSARPLLSNKVMVAPLRAICIAMVVFFGLGAALNFFSGRPVTGSSSLFGALAGVLAWHIASREQLVQLAAAIAFFAMAIAVTAFLWAGHGTRDYGLAGYPAVLFLGCVFLGSVMYWTLAALVVLSVTLIAIAEINGIKAMPGQMADFRNLINLWLIIGASALGGRVLMEAVRASLRREAHLSGALRSTEDRLAKLLRSSSNAIVVSRFVDGTYLEVNDTFLAMFGYAREEVIGKTSVALGVWESPHERERFLSPLRAGDAVRDFETRQRRKSGEWVDLLLSAELLDREGEICLIINATDVSARRAAERRAEYLSTRDALTGLPNRLLAIDRLQQSMKHARERGELVLVAHVDLDRFKDINDSVGRAHGDAVLREACSRLLRLTRSSDTLARVGGNEFLLISRGAANAVDAERLGASILAAFETPFDTAGHPLHITSSVGVSVFPTDSTDAETLLLYADTAVHEAKAEGRARVSLYARVMGQRVQDRLLVESSLRESLATSGLSLVYQPKYDMRSATITGVEALARWHHPKLGTVPPSVFIPVAEESDLICDVGQWVLQQACMQIAMWREQGLPALPVAVNLSTRQITHELPAQVYACTRASDVAPELLELEVTETMLIAQPEASRKVLEQVNRYGNRVVLDDFGVGYSSLGYVKLLHLNGIKIDRSFVHEINESRHDRAIVGAIVGLAHGLGLRVVAEGIETREQFETLKNLGCDEAQGFHLCRPMTGAEMVTHMQRLAA